ncbi:MAG TPA: hypothetical protein VFT62_00110 [Mycobacteriales bacterium]|nr:hypothetical protein [Mycobacteriales bacterium]
MSTPLATHLRLPPTAAPQDFVISRAQLLAGGLSPRQIEYRLGSRSWQAILPGVYLAQASGPSRRQMMIAALLYAGADSAIDDVDACRFHGIRAAVPDDRLVHVVAPYGSPARSRGFVVVRRTTAPIRVVRTERLRYLEPAAAVIAAARRVRSNRGVLALLSDAVQRRVVTYEELIRAHVQGPPRNAAAADAALGDIGAGIRSAPEADFRLLAESSTVLPRLLYNRLLRLPTGNVISPDALAEDAGLVHETNGRTAHSREDLFDDMQERHSVMTDAGLVVLHSAPRRLRQHGREVIARFERLYLANSGKGLPPGVVLLPLAA